MPDRENREKISRLEARRRLRELAKTGFLKLGHRIAVNEVMLEAAGIPTTKAVVPRELPTEVHTHCAFLRGTLAKLFCGVLAQGCAPETLRPFYRVPLDRAGGDPILGDSKRPISLLSPSMKLMGLVLARRLLPLFGGKD